MQNPTATIREQQAKVMGNSPTDSLRNASITDDKKKEEIKQKAIQDATEGKKITNADVAKLNSTSDEKLREQLFAQEGVIPVKENMSEEDIDDPIVFDGKRRSFYRKDARRTNPPIHEENEEYLQKYHDRALRINPLKNEDGTITTMAISDIKSKGKIYLVPSYDYTTGKVLTDPKDIENLNRKAIESGEIKPYENLYEGDLEREIEKMRERILFDYSNFVPLKTGGFTEMQEGGLTENDDDTLGATEKEVADDIPAQISEGELVVPANVVRYHGLSTYESLRQSALLGLKGLEKEGQLKKVDENGIPVEENKEEDKKEDKEKDTIKVQTVKMLTAKDGAFPDLSGDGKITRKDVLLARGVDLKEGGFPDLSGDGEVTQKDILIGRGVDLQEGGSPTIEEEPKTNFPIEYEKVIGRPVDPDLKKDLKPVDPRVTPREGQTITPDDSGNKETLTTPEGKNYRVTDPNLKITAQGPRTQNIVGGNYTGVDLENMPGFGRTSSSVTAPKPSTGEKLLSGITTVAALDKLFYDGKITESVYNWSKENIFDPLGEFLGFDKAATAIKTGPLAGSYIVNGQLTLADGTMDIVTSLSGADTVGKAIADGTVISANSYLQGIPANAEIITRYGTGLSDASHYAVFKDADGATQTVQVTNAQKAQLEAGNSIGGNVVSSDGLFSWKGGLATIGTALSLYDLVENGPSVTNVAGLGAGVGGMINAGVFGLSKTAGFGATGLGGALSTYATPLAFVALAAGLVEAFSGPPSNKVAEAAINFDNPEYKESDILIGGFTGKKFSTENTDAVTQLSASIGSYVSSMEQALEINIGGELFLDAGSTRGLRYGYVDGYDELGMYKYHKKDLDYELLSGQGQVGKGYLGEDAVTNLMNDIQDDTNVVVMFALADKAAGGEGYATYDNLPLYRQKINTLSTYRPSMAGSNSKAVLTEQERNILQGFQQKEFAEVTGEELAQVLTLYDKIAPTYQQNQQQNFNLSM